MYETISKALDKVKRICFTVIIDKVMQLFTLLRLHILTILLLVPVVCPHVQRYTNVPMYARYSMRKCILDHRVHKPHRGMCSFYSSAKQILN